MQQSVPEDSDATFLGMQGTVFCLPSCAQLEFRRLAVGLHVSTEIQRINLPSLKCHRL